MSFYAYLIEFNSLIELMKDKLTILKSNNLNVQLKMMMMTPLWRRLNKLC